MDFFSTLLASSLSTIRESVSSVMRIGQGFDVHAFGPGDHVTLGGVSIAYDRGLVAHSDGDVAVHALCDALLGALALGDIGKHFPPTDPRWAHADSMQFLSRCTEMVVEKGYVIGNIDITIICEKPKLAPHIEAMRERLAEEMACQINVVSVKATTSEKLGFTGRGEGIAAFAVALLQPRVVATTITRVDEPELRAFVERVEAEVDADLAASIPSAGPLAGTTLKQPDKRK